MIHANTHLIQNGGVCAPFQQCLDGLPVATLTGQLQWCKAAVVNAVHEAEGVQEYLDNITVTVPRRFVQCSVPKLSTILYWEEDIIFLLTRNSIIVTLNMLHRVKTVEKIFEHVNISQAM